MGCVLARCVAQSDQQVAEDLAFRSVEAVGSTGKRAVPLLGDCRPLRSWAGPALATSLSTHLLSKMDYRHIQMALVASVRVGRPRD